MRATPPHSPLLHEHGLPLRAVSTFRAFRRDPLAFFERLAQTGELVRFCAPGYHAIFVNEPAAVQVDVFDPGRFTYQALARRLGSYYTLFGGDQHQRIGQHLALLTLPLVLATLLQRVEPRLPAGVKVSLEAQITLRPRGGVPLPTKSEGCKYGSATLSPANHRGYSR